MEEGRQEGPSRLEKVNRFIRIIWAVILAVVVIVVLIAIMKRGTGY